MSTQFNSSNILYYPSIEFQSETWVKSSLLFWDKIYRIVPDGYKPKDSSEIKKAIANGFIEDLEITQNDLKSAADDFEEFCINTHTIPQGLDSSTFEIRLHTNKIDERLKPYFIQFAKNIDSEGFLNVPQNLANGYMFYLSDAMSKKRGISKITDSPDFFTAMSFYDFDGNIDEYLYNDEADTIYTGLIIDSLIPSKISSTSMEAIIQLTRKFEKEKKIFRDVVNEFSDRLSKIEDQQFIQKEIVEFQKQLTDNRNGRIEVLSQFFSDFNSAFLCVGLPTSLPGLLEHISPTGIYNPHDIARDIAICGIATIATAGNDFRKNWSKKKKNYYLELTRKLDEHAETNTGYMRLPERMKEFIND